MPSIESLKEVMLQIYDAAADHTLWPAILERLRGELNAAGSALVECDLADRSCRVVASAGTAMDFIKCYQEGLAREIPWIRDGPWYMQGRVSQGHEIISEEELARSVVYRRWLKPNGFFHRLCGVVRRSGDRVLFVVASRPAASGRYSHLETRFLSDLLPHMRLSERLNRKLLRTRAKASAFEHLPYALFIVDEAGRPVLANLAAEALLVRASLRLDGDGRLSAPTALATAQLRRALGALANGGDVPECQLLAPPPGGDHPVQLLTVAPIARPDRGFPGQGAAILVAAHRQAGSWPQGKLREVYGLTPAEERLALLILQGLRLDEAERKLGIRHSTARTHMRRIYAKTGTRRQGELIRLLMSVQFPFSFAAAHED